MLNYLLVYFILLIIFSQNLVNSTSNQESYQQWMSTRLNYIKKEPLPYIYGWDVLEIESINQYINPFKDLQLVIGKINKTQDYFNIFQKTNDNKLIPFKSPLKTIPIDSQIISINLDNNQSYYQLILVDSQGIEIYKCQQLKCSYQNIQPHDFGQVSKIIFNEITKTIYISSTDKGLFSIILNQEQSLILSINDIKTKEQNLQNIKNLAINQDLNILAIVTNQKLIFYYINNNYWRHEFINNINCLVWRQSDNSLWTNGQDEHFLTIFQFIKNKQLFNQPYYLMHNIGFIQQLPIGNFKFADIDNEDINRLYFGGDKGVVTFNGSIDEITSQNTYSNYKPTQGVGQIASPQSPFRYFYEQRWLPSGNITALTTKYGKCYISMEKGMAIIYQMEITLQEKAVHYEIGMQERFQHVLGYKADNVLEKPGDVSTGKEKLSDNQGMWTNMYLAQLAYRYKTTQDKEAKKLAWKSFRDIERLYKVIPPQFYGLMAKAVEYREETLPSDLWYYSTNSGYEQFMYKGNASSDDITTYFYTFPLMLEFVCETDGERELVFSYIQRTMDYIMENNWQMINVNGERTHWGFWDPENLNNDAEFYSERPLNSLEILSYLAVIYKYSKDDKYLDAIRELGINNQYFQNMMDWRFQDPKDVNYSDDELGFLAFNAFFFVQDALPQDLKDIFIQSLLRSWSIVQQYQPSWYTYQTAANLIPYPDLLKQVVSDTQLEFANQELQNWPFEMITWSVDNQYRRDIVALRDNLEKYEQSGENMVEVLRKDESVENKKWNSDPQRITNNANGGEEICATYWLLPYYLKLYYEQQIEQLQNHIYNN